MDGVDIQLAQRLRQRIAQELNGTSEQNGLYQIAAHRGVRTWEEYQYLTGRIGGLELAIVLIDETVRQMTDSEERSGLN